MNELVKKYAGPVFFILVCIVMIIQWQTLQSKTNELEQYKKSANIQKEVKDMEAKLEELKLKEQEYLEFLQQRDKLGRSLDELTRKTNELNKQKKERIQKDVEKLSTNDLSNTFSTIGFPNTITSK